MYISPRKICLLVVFTAAIVITGCISSLHPLYTTDTIVVDDRILGEWVQDITPTFSFGDTTYSMTISEEGDTTIVLGGQNDSSMVLSDEKFSSLFGSFVTPRFRFLTFERASSIIFERRDLSDTSFVELSGSRVSASTISIKPSTISMKPDGFKVKSIEEELPYYILSYEKRVLGKHETIRMLTHLTKINDVLYANFYPYQLGEADSFSSNRIKTHSFAKIEFDQGGLNVFYFDTDRLEELVNNRQIRLKHERVGIDKGIVITASTKELRSFLYKYGHREDLYEDPEKLTMM